MKNNKYSKSIALSTEEKLERLFKQTKQKASVSIKTEFFPKVRLIVSADYDTTLKMRFVDLWFNKWMSGCHLSTLWQSKSQSFEMWAKMAQREGTEVDAPVDQKQFDHNVTKAMILIVNEEITLLIEEKCFSLDNNKIKEQLVTVNKNITYALDGGIVIYKDGNLKLEYLSGLLSGWQRTAIFGTICNIAEFMVACSEVGVDFDKLPLFNAQGDDLLTRFKNIGDALQVITMLRSFGFNIHPKKSFYSQKHNEYLRRFYCEDEINGYPARMVNGLLWVYPGEDISYTISEKLSSTKDKWIKFGERMHFDLKTSTSLIIQEYNNMKIDTNTIKNFLSSKRINGGAGILPDNRLKVEIIPATTNAHVSFNKDQGYLQFKEKFGLYQEREMQKWTENVTETIKMIPIITEQTIVFKQAEKIDGLPYQIHPARKLQIPHLRQGYTNKVLFAKNEEFIGYVFPDVSPFIEASHAPKTWIYEYLTGQIEYLTPRVSKMSDEMASLAFEPFRPSLIQAMYHKKTTDNKWKRLLQYTDDHFSTIVRETKKLPTYMY